MKKSDLEKVAALLTESRRKLLDNARSATGGDVHLNPDDFADEIDSASSESGLAFIGRLRERERILLQKTEAALAKIEAGSYGICVECEEPIGAARLLARPVATLCIDCKSEQERRE